MLSDKTSAIILSLAVNNLLPVNSYSYCRLQEKHTSWCYHKTRNMYMYLVGGGAWRGTACLLGRRRRWRRRAAGRAGGRRRRGCRGRSRPFERAGSCWGCWKALRRGRAWMGWPSSHQPRTLRPSVQRGRRKNERKQKGVSNMWFSFIYLFRK